MVIAIVAKEIVKTALSYGAKYFKYEKSAFDKLYKGFPPGVAPGVRHGLAVGSAIGSYITGKDLSDPNGIQKTNGKSTSYPPYKTRSGRTRRRYPECPDGYYRNKFGRCTRISKRKRS